MIMTKVESEDLLKVLERIRAEKYPDVPAKLIADLVQAQFDNQDSRAEGARATRQLVDEFLRVTIAES